jgi:surfeit locus 1 family protein
MKRLRAFVVYWTGRWRPGWKMTLFVVFMLPVLIGLATWQLARADEKRWYETRQLERMGQPPQEPPSVLQPDSAFVRVVLEGRYESGEHYLVDNRVHGGRPGYWAVSRFRALDDRIWLINRGWLPGAETRGTLPEVPTPTGVLRLVGVLWPDTGMPPLLAPDPWSTVWPKRVQRLDIHRMAQEAPVAVPVEVRLEPGEPGGFVAAPLDAMFSPAVHFGYAFQWFGLALALVIGYLIFGFRRYE